ncbi:DUF3265 domain-containing protein [Vibrio vulnificus]|nr:DUF3265 domain-containing protein [Vibrio vulnificus]
MTKRLSGIWHAWHFQFALGSVIKSLCGSFCIACLHPLTRRYGLGEKMAFVLANTATKNQALYAFEPSLSLESVEFKTVRLEHVHYDHDGNILVDSDTLKEFEVLGIPVFERKSSAKQFLVGLNLVGKAKYVGVRYKRAFEHQYTDLGLFSSWTELNR